MKEKVKLIEGVFNSDEAQELLLNLFESKIKFHELKNFQSKQRYGKEDTFAVNKIAMLKNNASIIHELFKEAIQKNQKVKIDAVIKMQFSDK
jgi:dihydroorotase